MKRFWTNIVILVTVVTLLASILLPALWKAKEASLMSIHRYSFIKELKEKYDQDGKLPEKLEFEYGEIMKYYPENWGKDDKVFVFYRRDLGLGHEKYIIGLGNGDCIVTNDNISIDLLLNNFELTFLRQEEEEAPTPTEEEKGYYGKKIYLKRN